MSNVILFMSDEHSYSYSSVYGNPLISTPNMEMLANNGTVYKNAYCPSPLCAPSRSAVMSGKRVFQIQVYNNCILNLKTDYPSYGEMLSRQGIYTVYAGKCDVYNSAENLGFSELIMAKDRNPPGDTNFTRRPFAIRMNAAKRAGHGVKEDAFINDNKTIDAAIEWIASKGALLEQPWVLVINALKPHFPQYVTQKYWDMYPVVDMPQYGSECESAAHPYAGDLRRHFETDLFTKEQTIGLRRGYLGCITYVDEQIGRIMDTLKETGLIEDTNFIYTSDHGDMMGKFGMWWKCSLYEDSIRVPCIAAGPDFEKGKIVETPVDLLDVQASIFKAVGAQRPEDWVGEPLQEIQKNNKDRVVFSEYHGHGTRSGAFMVRKGDWKLIYYMEAPNQLFNLADDPNELNNLYERFPKKGKELEEELRLICSPEKENERAHQFEAEQNKLLDRF